MTSQLRPGVLFDLDGTLIDTNYLHTLAWSRALRDAGEWALMNAIHRLVGMGAGRAFSAKTGPVSAVTGGTTGGRWPQSVVGR